MSLLLTCAQVVGKELQEDEVNFWRKFLSTFSLAELRYAFDCCTRNSKWFPKPSDITELCEAYRSTEVSKVDAETPIGCDRCDWTGFYTVTWRSKVERVVAECPCRTNVSLRTKCTKQWATMQEKREMYMAIKAFGDSKDMNKAIDKPKQISGIIPTTKELAAQLATGRRWESE